MLAFGEAVLYKLPTKGPASAPDGNMGTKWREGTFVGYHRASNVYIMTSVEGMATSRSLQRRPPSNRWSAERIFAIKATPWSEREKPEVTVTFAEPTTAEPATTNTAPPNPRRFLINKSDLEQYGYTDGCPQCDYINKYGNPRPGATHSDSCRTRLIKEISSTEAGQQRMAAWSE